MGQAVTMVNDLGNCRCNVGVEIRNRGGEAHGMR
jgi:hypothetical protein